MFVTVLSFLNTASVICALLTPWAVDVFDDENIPDDTITLWDIDELLKPKYLADVPVPYKEWQIIVGLMYASTVLAIVGLVTTYMAEKMDFVWRVSIGTHFLEFCTTLSAIILYAINADDIFDERDTIKPYFVGFVFTVISMSLSMSVITLGLRQARIIL